ncbi:MAG: efflux RND transporter periplasmic adaptor subunit [Hyphomonadaceae bacterium]|nr:efflux RND transporter periplasmic adaptor subunit [Hyphomonadaceae bacterium]
MKPELFSGAQNLWRRVGAAGEATWERAVAAPTVEGRRRKILLIFAGLFVGLIAGVALVSHLGGERIDDSQVDTRQAVTAVTVAPRAFNTIIEINGQARPQRDLQVTAPASGVRILELLVDEGDQVREGQPMARLDTAVSQAQIRAAEASVAEARSAAVRARSEYERAESIRDSGALSTEAIEQRRAAAIAADARLTAAQAQLEEVNARLGGGFVRAPASGLVIDRMAEIGRSVDGQVLFRIAEGDLLEVAAEVAESEMLALQEGQEANFRLVDGTSVTGTLRRLPASIDPQTRTGEALFALPRASRVRAGMFLRGAVQLPERQALAVPQSSVLFEAGEAFVFVIRDDDTVAKTLIAIGARDGDWVEVTSGLDAGMRVVGSGAAFLQSGDEVRPLAPVNAAPTQTPEQPTAQPAPTDLRGRED